MRHDWYDPPPKTQEERVRRISVYGVRKCRNCGAYQEKNDIQEWGRVIGYQWLPKVGRCVPVPRVGDVVRTWYDNGMRHGMTILLGYVIAAGPKFFRVRWLSGMERRVERACPKGVEQTTDPELIADAERRFKRCGVEIPRSTTTCTT